MAVPLVFTLIVPLVVPVVTFLTPLLLKMAPDKEIPSPAEYVVLLSYCVNVPVVPSKQV